MTFTGLLALSIGAGFVGTAAMTISQEVELRFISKRPISFSPAIALFKLLKLDFEKLSQRAKVFSSYAVHFTYGTTWGFPLALFYFFNYTGIIAVGISYLLIVLIQGWITVWLLGIAGPPWTWGGKAVLFEIIHKTVYTAFVMLSFILLTS